MSAAAFDNRFIGNKVFFWFCSLRGRKCKPVYLFLCYFCEPKQSYHYFCGWLFPRTWNQRTRVVTCDLLLTSVLVHLKWRQIPWGLITSKGTLFSLSAVTFWVDTTSSSADGHIHLWRFVGTMSLIKGWVKIFVSLADLTWQTVTFTNRPLFVKLAFSRNNKQSLKSVGMSHQISCIMSCGWRLNK